ncbi:MAG: type IX secretion system membrane protein PorP/SprF [Chitinophagaceae bacterium]|nr:MAG: type IX secretion system membrane protein PorP/SprF [Chitinophagaceae bacterium]
MKIRIFCLVAIVISCLFTLKEVKAQDIHFSQYFASPLNLNPAMTGNFNGSFRVAGIYRNQYFSVTRPYVTYGGSFDASLFRNQLNFDQMGVGLNVYSDVAGDGNLTTQSATASFAYHKVLDEYNRHSISVGVQGGVVQKRVDVNSLIFESQIDADGNVNTGLPSGENFANTSILYPDFNAGILWQSVISDRALGYGGFSLHHINQPEESFLENSDNRLEHRYVGHGGFDIRVGDYATIMPGFLIMMQSEAREISIGSALGYDLSGNSTVFFGAWHRLQDAIILYTGFEISDLRVGFSYDINTSDLRTASRGNGGLELSLIYIHGMEDRQSITPVRFCPRF